jgi:hypothetical protein
MIIAEYVIYKEITIEIEIIAFLFIFFLFLNIIINNWKMKFMIIDIKEFINGIRL